MITKKKILSHILWGGVFGVLGGIIAGYGGAFSPLSSASNIQQYLFFLSHGLFLGLALGISDKSIKKTFYGVFGGFVGGLFFYTMYAIAQIHKISIPGAVAFLSLLLFSPVIYIVFVCCSFGIMYKSFYKAIKGIIGGIVALLAVSPFIFLLLIGYGLASAWPASPDAVRSVIICLLGGYLLWGISLNIGIFIGTELGDKKSQ